MDRVWLGQAAFVSLGLLGCGSFWGAGHPLSVNSVVGKHPLGLVQGFGKTRNV